MRATWANIPLGEILTERKETPSMDAILAGEIPILSKIGFDRGQIELRECPGTRTGMILIQPGDLVLSGINAAKGAIAIYDDGNHLPIAATIHYGAYAPKKDKVDIRYLWWFLRSKGFREILTRHVPGGIKTELKARRLLPVPIPLPSLSEQRRIVVKIEQLAAKIDEVRRLRRNVLEQSSALASSLHFSLSQNRVAELAQLLELDEHREVVLPNVEYPQIGIRGFGGGLFIKSAVRGAETTYRYFNRLEAGQVILSQVKGWEGAVAVSRAEHAGFFVSPEYRTFRCIAGTCDPAYVDNVVTSPWFHALLAEATRGQGARRQRTRPELFLRIKIPMPHYESQRRAVPILDRVRMVPRLQSETAAELDALLPSILDKAFKGEL